MNNLLRETTSTPIHALFNPGDGFDVHIDAARFLPDNTTILKVVARDDT